MQYRTEIYHVSWENQAELVRSWLLFMLSQRSCYTFSASSDDDDANIAREHEDTTADGMESVKNSPSRGMYCPYYDDARSPGNGNEEDKRAHSSKFSSKEELEAISGASQTTTRQITEQNAVKMTKSSGKDEHSANDEYLGGEGVQEVVYLFTWTNPWLPATFVTLGLGAPVLFGNILVFNLLTGKIWPASPLVLHLFGSLVVARCYVLKEEWLQQPIMRLLTSVASLADIVLFAFVYPLIWGAFVENFFMDNDDTVVIEWSNFYWGMRLFRIIGFIAALLRTILGATTIMARVLSRHKGGAFSHNAVLLRSLRCLAQPYKGITPSFNVSLRLATLWLLNVILFFSACILIWCMVSLGVHLLPTNAPQYGSSCDPLDETECIFPFPSFHHMMRDNTTATGWRVNLQENDLPPLKGQSKPNPDALNKLDGFSTMAPLLFYVEGLKEAQDAGVDQLQGLSSIAQSMTAQSVTLLLDVSAQSLVAHSAEIDYADRKHPCVMVMPAAPLKHNSHYALAVVNARDAFGRRLDQTRGMQYLLADNKSDRRARYMDILVPALEASAEWLSFANGTDSLQLLFDFQTISEVSQLGTVRAVRDGVLAELDSKDWSWEEHVRTIRVVNHDCSSTKAKTARTVHAEMDVPWFLESFGPGQRAALVDSGALLADRSSRLGVAKFVVNVPCSVRAAALGIGGGQPVRAVMEYGHGFLNNRNETGGYHHNKLADEQGYVLVGMDWRGLSTYDLPLFAKVAVSDPMMFHVVRDNLIQGFANKYALQHFVKTWMMSMEWTSFTRDGDISLVAAPTYEGKPPIQVFYGASLGGILGAAYGGLSGATSLIDRVVLGVPGTPLAMIMSRSVEFDLFYQLARINIYTGRHVRIFLSLMQMGLDSVEGSGVLALPVREPYPRMLLQAGLGDVSVPSPAAEALARALNASVLSNNPVPVYGVPIVEMGSNGSYATLTELMYDKEFASLPVDNVPAENNGVHLCVRTDSSMTMQMTEFINTGHVMNPCENDCHRNTANCNYWTGRSKNTFWGSLF
jgi:hypothetical protein